MLLKMIKKMEKVQNLPLDQLNIRNGSKRLSSIVLQEASPCANCSRLDHVELDYLVMVVQGQGTYVQTRLTRKADSTRKTLLSMNILELL